MMLRLLKVQCLEEDAVYLFLITPDAARSADLLQQLFYLATQTMSTHILQEGTQGFSKKPQGVLAALHLQSCIYPQELQLSQGCWYYRNSCQWLPGTAPFVASPPGSTSTILSIKMALL